MRDDITPVRSVLLKKARRDLVRLLKPETLDVPLVRLGGDSDGAYLLPDKLSGIVACFSPGVASRKTFEDGLAHHYGVRSHLLDFSTDIGQLETPLLDGLQTFSKKWLGSQTGHDVITLQDWIDEREAESIGDLILQMDIEGSEYDVLSGVSEEVLERFRIVVVEFHQVGSQLSGQDLNAPVLKVLRKLESIFAVAHIHPNNAGGARRLPGDWVKIPEVLEVTFVRRDAFEVGGIREKHGRPRLPHPEDIPRNVFHLKPLFLGIGWLGFFLWSLSMRERAEDTLGYLRDWLIPRFKKNLLRALGSGWDRLYLFVPSSVRRHLTGWRTS